MNNHLSIVNNNNTDEHITIIRVKFEVFFFFFFFKITKQTLTK